MQEYKFDLSNAAFVAAGVTTQAKGLLYRMKPDKGRSVQKVENYKLGTISGLMVRTGSSSAERSINNSEEIWDGNSDYWLGKAALTDLLVRVPGQGVLLINDVIMNVSLQKEIVKTVIVGRAGTIKEYITDGDYQITMSVGLVAINDRGEIIDQYPERAVLQLREILEKAEALEVNSVFLDIFDINRIVVTGFSVKQMTYSNRQVVEITAISDDDYFITYLDY